MSEFRQLVVLGIAGALLIMASSARGCPFSLSPGAGLSLGGPHALAGAGGPATITAPRCPVGGDAEPN